LYGGRDLGIVVNTTGGADVGWYIVIKTIKGHRYRYRQRTWREDGRVRTQSQYLGRVGDSAAEPSSGQAVNTTAPSGDEAGLIEKLFDPAQKAPDWNVPWPRRFAARDRPFEPDPRLFALAAKMGVTGITRPWKGRGGMLRPDGAWYNPGFDAVQMPDASRFKDAEEFLLVFLHELTHATRHRSRVGRVRNNRAEEELVAELGANLVALRLGLRSERIAQSAYYLQLWLSRCDDPKLSRTFAEWEANRAADYIVAKWRDVNTTK
jgi:hypothetical protein